MKKILVFVSVLQFCMTANAQKDSTLHKKHFFRYAGIAVAAGSASSSTGYFGLYWPLLVSSKHVDLSVGFGTNGLTPGLGLHTDIQKEFSFFVSGELGYCNKSKAIFNEDEPGERRYDLGNTNFVYYGTGVMWNPKNNLAEDCFFSVVFKVGYRQRISDYSITPQNPENSEPTEIESTYHTYFESRFFWNVGLRVNGLMHQKNDRHFVEF